MWKTIRYNTNGKPLWDINEQGKLYSYREKKLIGKITREVNPYIAVASGNTTCYLHRLVAEAFPEICGEWFKGCEVHHKDGNGLNNCATNLIVCTKEEHVEYHRLLKEKKEKHKRDTEQYLKNLKNKEVRVYCRKSKIRKNGTSPIELYVKEDGKREIVSTPFFSKPERIAKRDYPKEFLSYIKKLNLKIK